MKRRPLRVRRAVVGNALAERVTGTRGIASAGAFSIQPLEGSRFGTVVLWVLNGAGEAEGWGIREPIGSGRGNRGTRKDFPGPQSLAGGTAGTLLALVFRWALKSR